MKLGLIAFVLWSIATVSGAMAQCSGTQICGTTGTATSQTSVATFTPSVVKNQVFSIGDGTVANTLTITTCQGNCTPPTLAGIAGFFANQGSPVSCPAILPPSLQACTGQLPAGWSSGPVVAAGANFTVTFSFSPAGASTTSLVGNSAQGNAGVSITSNSAATTPLYGLLQNKMVCVKNSDVGKTGSTPWYNQEWHQSSAAPGGNITDYKLGPTDTRDPSKQIGTWSVGGTNDCVLTYVYSPNNLTFTYNVWQNGSTYTFCKLSGPDTPPIFSIPTTQLQGPGLTACTP